MNQKVDNRGRAVIFGMVQAVSGFFFGYILAQFNSFFKFFMAGRFGDQYPESEHDSILSNLNTIMTAGALFSTVSGSFLLKYVSRLWLFYITIFVFSTASLVQIWAPLEVVYAMRFFVGYIINFNGLFSSLVLRESLPSYYVGFFGGFFSVSITSGYQTAYLLGFEFFEKNYHFGFFIPVILEAIRFFLFVTFLNVESPNYVYDSLSRKYGPKKKYKQKDTKMKTDVEKEAIKKKDNQIQPNGNENINGNHKANGHGKENGNNGVKDIRDFDTEVASKPQKENGDIKLNGNAKINSNPTENGIVKVEVKVNENQETSNQVIEMDSKQELKETAKEKELVGEDDPKQQLVKKKFFNDKRVNKYMKTFYKKEKWDALKNSLYLEYRIREGRGGNKNICSLIFSKTYYKQFILILTLNLVHQLTGISVIVFYSTTLYRDLDIENPEMKTFIIGKIFFKISLLKI